MKDRLVSFCFFGLFACLCVSLFFNYKQYRDARELPPPTVDVEVSSTETASLKPLPAEVKDIGKIHVPVKRVAANPDSVTMPTPGILAGSLKLDGDSVEIPITQKVYSDSLYTAYVSGYGQQLDSIRVTAFTIRETVTVTKPVTKYRRWNVGLIGGYGYGFTSRQLEPFVGIGFTWSLFSDR